MNQLVNTIEDASCDLELAIDLLRCFGDFYAEIECCDTTSPEQLNNAALCTYSKLPRYHNVILVAIDLLRRIQQSTLDEAERFYSEKKEEVQA